MYRISMGKKIGYVDPAKLKLKANKTITLKTYRKHAQKYFGQDLKGYHVGHIFSDVNGGRTVPENLMMQKASKNLQRQHREDYRNLESAARDASRAALEALERNIHRHKPVYKYEKYGKRKDRRY